MTIIAEQAKTLFMDGNFTLQDVEGPGCDDSSHSLVLSGKVPSTYTDDQALTDLTKLADAQDWSSTSNRVGALASWNKEVEKQELWLSIARNFGQSFALVTLNTGRVALLRLVVLALA